MNKILITTILMVVVLSSFGYAGVTKIGTGIWYDLSATDPANWASTTSIYGLTFDSTNNLIYTGLLSGKFGVYNKTDGIWYDLSATDPDNWVSTSNVNSLTFDSTNNLIYTGLQSGKFGVYNKNANEIYNFYLNNFAETTGIALNIYNITLINSTHTQTYLNQSNQFFCNSTCYFRGKTTITISKDGYTNKNYYYNGDGSLYNISTYLLADADSTEVRFHVVDHTYNSIIGAMVQAKRLIGSELVVVSEGLTDISGTANLNLDKTYTYTIIAYHPDDASYMTSSGTLTPTQTDYTIYLLKSVTISTESVFTNNAYYVFPFGSALSNATHNQTFYINLNNTAGTITLFGLRIYDSDNNILCASNTTFYPYGGTSHCFLNLTSLNGTLTMTAFFHDSEYGLFTQNFSYYVYTYGALSDHTFASALRSMADMGIPALIPEIVLLFIIIILIVTLKDFMVASIIWAIFIFIFAPIYPTSFMFSWAVWIVIFFIILLINLIKEVF